MSTIKQLFRRHSAAAAVLALGAADEANAPMPA